MQLPSRVKMVEVGPRDGLQNEVSFVPSLTKIELINRLTDTGLKVIEATSFVSPKSIPQLADHEIVFQGIQKDPDVQYPVLVPNIQGLNAAVAVGVKEVAVFTTPSELFSQHNTNCSVDESKLRIDAVMQAAKSKNIKVRAYLSCVMGCPYEGSIAINKIIEMCIWLHNIGCYEISLGDTIGIGTPGDTCKLLKAVVEVVPVEKIAVHFHDTYGQALANIYAALGMGVCIIDSAVSGLGGCPYAQGATGNVATEDVLYMLNGMGIETGVDLKKLIKVGRYISDILGRKSQSKVNRAFK